MSRQPLGINLGVIAQEEQARGGKSAPPAPSDLTSESESAFQQHLLLRPPASPPSYDSTYHGRQRSLSASGAALASPSPKRTHSATRRPHLAVVKPPPFPTPPLPTQPAAMATDIARASSHHAVTPSSRRLINTGGLTAPVSPLRTDDRFTYTRRTGSLVHGKVLPPPPPHSSSVSSLPSPASSSPRLTSGATPSPPMPSPRVVSTATPSPLVASTAMVSTATPSPASATATSRTRVWPGPPVTAHPSLAATFKPPPVVAHSSLAAAFKPPPELLPKASPIVAQTALEAPPAGRRRRRWVVPTATQAVTPTSSSTSAALSSSSAPAAARGGLAGLGRSGARKRARANSMSLLGRRTKPRHHGTTFFTGLAPIDEAMPFRLTASGRVVCSPIGSSTTSTSPRGSPRSTTAALLRKAAVLYVRAVAARAKKERKAPPSAAAVGKLISYAATPALGIQLLRRAKGLYERTFGERHPSVAAVLKLMGCILVHTGEKPARTLAMEYFRRAAALCAVAFGPDNPVTMDVEYNIALLHSQRGDHAKAAMGFARVLSSYEVEHGVEAPATKAIRAKLLKSRRQDREEQYTAHFSRGLVELQEARPTQALQAFRRCLRLQHRDSQAAYSIAVCHCRLGKLQLALQWLTSAVQWGSCDPHLVVTDEDLAPLRAKAAFWTAVAPLGIQRPSASSSASVSTSMPASSTRPTSSTRNNPSSSTAAAPAQ